MVLNRSPFSLRQPRLDRNRQAYNGNPCVQRSTRSETTYGMLYGGMLRGGSASDRNGVLQVSVASVAVFPVNFRGGGLIRPIQIIRIIGNRSSRVIFGNSDDPADYPATFDSSNSVFMSNGEQTYSTGDYTHVAIWNNGASTLVATLEIVR